MSKHLYTNTSNFTAIVGLVVTTALLSYVSTNSTKLVEGTVSLAKDGIEKASKYIQHGNKQQYHVLARDFDGNLYDTGRTIWK